MKNLSDSKLFKTLLFILTILVITKIIWLVVSLLFLPKEGVEHEKITKLKPLYYRIKLARKPIYVKPKVIKKAPPPPPVSSMRGIKLLGLYNASDIIVVTVKKGNKTKTLEKSEDRADNIDGFVLTSAGRNYAIFRKNGKDFKLELTKKIKNSNKSYIRVREPETRKHYSKEKGIRKGDDDTQKIISRNLLTSYTKNIDKIWKDIGIGDYRKNGVLKGFKVNFVKRGSDFAKLGLRKGDILKAINGEELNSYNAAFSFYKDINSIDDLTLTIERNNQEMELEYEIK
jgi:general secretion pathway protein C